MPHQIHESLLPLAVDIDTLLPLENNPRRGNVDAIIASYREFGQIKPIVVRPNFDGTSTIIAGNHQVEAAKRLGWDKIAVVEYAVDDRQAIAFALADNRTMELGYTEPELLEEAVLELSDFYPELMEGLGWDEFAAAEIEQKFIREDNQIIESGGGYIAPEVMLDVGNGFGVPPVAPPVGASAAVSANVQAERHTQPTIDETKVLISTSDDGGHVISARSTVDQDDAVIRGSTTVSPSSAPQAVVQYTLVFDSHEQQRRWYDFIKWLRTDPAVVGTTTAEKLMDFIGQHTEI